MKTLKQEYAELKERVFKRYEELVKELDAPHYFCESFLIGDNIKETFTNIKSRGTKELVWLYYNNIYEQENLGYLLAVDKNTIYIIDNGTWQLVYIKVESLNGINNVIKIIENLK